MTYKNLPKLLFTLLFAGISLSQVFGQVVYQYSFANLCGDLCTFASPYTGTPDFLATGLSNSSWATNYSGGFISYSGACGTTACQSLAISHNNYPAATTYTLTFTVNPNYSLNITGLSFWNRESTSGPSTADITINGTSAVSALGLAGTTWAATGNLTPTGTFNNLTGTVSLVISLSGASATGGTFRLDSFIVNGVVSALNGATVYNVTGGGTLCAGGAPIPVGLSGSQTGYTYQLFNGANSASVPVTGTGSAITFGSLSAAGTYTVVATNTGTQATTNMNGSATIVVNPAPVITPSPAVTTCASTYTLDAGSGFTTYAWSNAGTAETTTVSSNGNYAVTVTNSNGCSASAIDTVAFVTGLQVVVTPSQNPVCIGKPVTISATGGNTYAWSTSATTAIITASPSGNTLYTVTVTTPGCTATGSVIITTLSPSTSTVSKSICSGQSYNGHTVGGNYTDTLTSSNGCDSIVSLSLQVSSPSSTTASQTICAGQNYNGHTASGNYTDTLFTVSGCDSIIVLTLTVLNPVTASTTQTICAGQSYNGHAASGNYTDTLHTGTGCDSIVTLQLTVTNALTGATTQIICHGQNYNGYTTTGQYSDTLTSVGGCDSIVALNLTVLPAITDTIYQGICKYDTFMGHTTTGTYRDTFTSASGCDSLVVLHLKVHPLPYINDSLPFDTVCNTHVAITLSGATPVGGTYYGQGVSNGLFIPSSAVIGNDTIYYSYTDTNGCSKSYWQLAYVEQCDTNVTPTGINSISANSFVVSPNPTSGFLNIESNNPAEVYGYALYDLLGREVMAISEGVLGEKKSIDLGNLPAGVYLLNITQHQATVVTSKIVKL